MSVRASGGPSSRCGGRVGVPSAHLHVWMITRWRSARVRPIRVPAGSASQILMRASVRRGRSRGNVGVCRVTPRGGGVGLADGRSRGNAGVGLLTVRGGGVVDVVESGAKGLEDRGAGERREEGGEQQ